MSRSRNIKPGFFKNEILVELPFDVRLLFVGLWTLADRDGRFEDRPVKIKMEVFPADSVDVNAGLQALHDNGFIVRYEVEGRRYCQILAWNKHQNPHVKEAASIIPEYNKHHASTMQAREIPERAGLIPDSLNLIPDSLEKTLERPAARFEEFWAEYPNKKGKAQAEKFWKRDKLDCMANTILADVERRKEQDWDWLKDGGQYIPHGSTYVNEKRWLDEIKPRPNAPPEQQQKSKALQAIEKLQGMKNELAQNGNQHRIIEADTARLGMGSGDGFDGRHFGGVDGSIDA